MINFKPLYYTLLPLVSFSAFAMQNEEKSIQDFPYLACKFTADVYNNELKSFDHYEKDKAIKVNPDLTNKRWTHWTMDFGESVPYEAHAQLESAYIDGWQNNITLSISEFNSAQYLRPFGAIAASNRSSIYGQPFVFQDAEVTFKNGNNDSQYKLTCGLSH